MYHEDPWLNFRALQKTLNLVFGFLACLDGERNFRRFSAEPFLSSAQGEISAGTSSSSFFIMIKCVKNIHI